MNDARDELTRVSAALETLVEVGRGLVDRDHHDDAAALRDRIGERLALGDELTVIALAGGTGVGKSALTNRLAGSRVVDEGVRRPTTDHPVALAQGFDAATQALLDHLAIQDRRIARTLPAGMVVVDLPDHDSVVASHRLTSARLAARVDALVVVVDPLKYARADLHHGPLADLRRHAEVVTVVLNRSDELSDADLTACRADLVARLDADGLVGVEVMTTSAATGSGIDQLRDRLTELAAARRAAVQRLLADAAQLADRMGPATGDAPDLTGDADRLTEPLFEATDAGRSGLAAASSYRQTARVACRSPLARAIRLPGRLAAEVRDAFVAPDPTTHPPSRATAAIEAALARHLDLDTATGPAHTALAGAIERIAADAGPPVVDAVDRVPRQPSRRRWWGLTSGARGIAETASLVGLVWLVVNGVVRWLALPELPLPMVTDELSWPAALFLYGLAARLVLGALSRGLITVGARRHAEHVAHEVRHQLSATLADEVVGPVREELERHRTVQAQLEILRLAAGRPETHSAGTMR